MLGGVEKNMYWKNRLKYCSSFTEEETEGQENLSDLSKVLQLEGIRTQIQTQFLPIITMLTFNPYLTTVRCQALFGL